MATTVGNFSAIDDTEVDAESPITETLVTRLRDNSYWIDAGTRRTTETDTSKVLQPDGAGGVVWGGGGGGGAKGTLTYSLALTPQTVTTSTSGTLRISYTQHFNTTSSNRTIGSGSIIIDLSDDTFDGSGGFEKLSVSAYTSGSAVYTGTLTSSFASVGIVGPLIQARRSSGNLEIQLATGPNTFVRMTYDIS